MSRRRNKQPDTEYRVVLDAAATAYGPVVRGHLLDRMDPRFDSLGQAYTVPPLPPAEGDGEPMTAVASVTWTDADGNVHQVARGDRFGSEHPIVKANPNTFVRFELPEIEQRDCAIWTETR